MQRSDTSFFIVIADAGKIIKFFKNHHAAKALYDEMRSTENGCSLSLPVPIRWYSQYISLQSVLKSRYAIQKVCDMHQEKLNKISKDLSNAVIKLARSAAFWVKVTNVVKLIEFPAKIIGN